MEEQSRKQVLLELMRPDEIDLALEACPTIFLPIGTIEWHGRHNLVGLDALKAHKLCELAALAGGGAVHPPHYGAVGGLDEPHTFIMDPENDIQSSYFSPWIERWCTEAYRNGARAIILLTGHYGPSQQMNVRSIAVKMSQVLGIAVLGIPEYFLALDEGYYGDHAASFETSLMMYLFPSSVDLSLLGNEPHQGVYGKDPKEFSSRSEGERLAGVMLRRLAELSLRMPGWKGEVLEAYIRGEQAVLRRQLLLARELDTLWGGWRNISQGVFDAYPGLLVRERFSEIEELAEKL